MSLIPNDQFFAISTADPDPQMDDPKVSSFWRRRAALTLGMANPNAPWVDIISAAEHREYQRDVEFAGKLALRHLRIEVDHLTAEVKEAAAAALLAAADDLESDQFPDIPADIKRIYATALRDRATRTGGGGE